MTLPGRTWVLFWKMVWPHHFSSWSGVGGRLPMKGPVGSVSRRFACDC